jgi:hypothetical protein
LEEHGEESQECKGEETGNVREKTRDHEENAGDGENRVDEESKVSQTLRTQK